jgi:hypothetical protein
MSYVKVGNEKLGIFRLAMIALLAVALGFNPGARAQDIAPPISGALGQVQSVGDHAITIQNKSGLFHIDIKQPLTTYHAVPSDLNRITDNDYIPLTVDHGAPLRLLVPVKLGLKNIKAITRITYTKDEPPDYWAKRGYSRYDGI